MNLALNVARGSVIGAFEAEQPPLTATARPT